MVPGYLELYISQNDLKTSNISEKSAFTVVAEMQSAFI